MQFLAENIIYQNSTTTEGESQIYSIFLVQLCDLLAPLGFILLTNKSKVILAGYIKEIQNMFECNMQYAVCCSSLILQ